MKKNSIYQFTLVLDGVDEQTSQLEALLYKAGCDDALINFRNGAVYLDFDREATNLENAVISAIQSVENISKDITVVSVAPDDFVSESEIANRLNIKRQTISLWVRGQRRKQIPFPKPVLKLSEKSPLWRWSEVAQWLCDQKKIEDKKIVENAKFLANMNLALNERDQKTRRILNRLRGKLPAKKNAA